MYIRAKNSSTCLESRPYKAYTYYREVARHVLHDHFCSVVPLTFITIDIFNVYHANYVRTIDVSKINKQTNKLATLV